MIDLLDKIVAAGGDVAVVGGDLRLRIPNGLLTQAEKQYLAEHKASIVKLLADGPAAETPVVATAEPDLDREIVVPPAPCLQCGGFMFWWDFLGRPHCQQCELATRSARTREAAERIRRRTA